MNNIPFDIHKIIYPAVIFDKNFVITDKNKAASVKYSNFRRGSSIRRHLNKNDCNRVESMKLYENIAVELKSKSINAVIYRFKDGFILKTCVVVTELVSRVSKVLELNEQYLNECISLYNMNMDNDKMLRFKMRKLLYLQITLNDYLKLTKNLRSDTVSSNDLHKQIVEMIRISGDLLNNMRIVLENKMPAQPMIFNYCAKDMELIIYSATSVMSILTTNNKIKLECRKDENYIFLSLSTECSQRNEYKSLLDGNSGDLLLLSEKKGEVFYMLEYINRLCEYYNYTLELVFPQEKNQLALAITIIDNNNSSEIVFNEPKSFVPNIKLANILFTPALEEILSQ